MCSHKNIIVAHYGVHFEGEIGDRIACEIRCKDCNTIVYQYDKKEVKEVYSYNKYVQGVYDYIDKNKDKFETLIDLTCDNLNDRYKIKDGLKSLSL